MSKICQLPNYHVARPKFSCFPLFVISNIRSPFAVREERGGRESCGGPQGETTERDHRVCEFPSLDLHRSAREHSRVVTLPSL